MTTVTLTEADDNRSVNAKVGDKIVVRLSESAATGYRWAIDHLDENIVVPLGGDFALAGSGVGAGGELILEFEAKERGSTSLVLKLWRDWEGDRSILSRFNAALNIE